MADTDAQLLDDYLREVRRVARRRGGAALLVDLTLTGTLAAVIILGACGLTLRGDLGQLLGVPLAALSLCAVVIVRVRRLREQLASPSTVARAIARNQGPLRRRSLPAELEQDAILRHEILGATQLWREVDEASARSPELARAYVERIGVQTLELDADLALPRPRRGARALGLVAALGLAVGLGLSPLGARGLTVLLAGVDARPPPPPQPVWTSLALTLDYPEHTRRPDRRVPNPSGSLRVPAGTRVTLELEAAGEADAARLVASHDRSELSSAPAAEVVELTPLPRSAGASPGWAGELTIHGPISWVVVLLDDADDNDNDDAEALAVAERRSAPMRIELEADAMPEVELLPLPRQKREASETDRVELRFTARDDFGLVGAELVYELLTPEGELDRHRLLAGVAPGPDGQGGARSWRHRYSWDLSAIPIEQRSAVTYWIEVRDNDPGLGLIPLRDGPGKVAASARQQLLVHDREAEHAANIRDLQTIRDAAVDMLAARLTTQAFTALDDPLALRSKLRTARELHEGATILLTMIAAAVDALAVDTMVAERDVETLAAIHARLLALHREEAALLEVLPVDAEAARPGEREPLLRKLAPHNKKELEQLEDEIIRLDDLVDGQIIDHIETLVARLQASQQKLVEKLEQLAAGDESMRPEIEQLEQRIREDMRRVQEARAQLRKEVGEEFMNLDAFKAMEARMRSQELLAQLERGDVEGALQQAKEQLESIRSLREQVQRDGAEGESPALSEEDRQRMKMLRELSRLQDEQTGVRGETRRLRERWRDAVGQQRATDQAAERAADQAERMRAALDEIDDSNLSREGREAWEDAREALERLEASAEASPDHDPDAKADSEGPSARQLELFEAARDAAEALERARAGAKSDESEAKALRKLQREADRLRDQLREPLPDPDEILEQGELDQLTQLGERQRSLRERAQRLLEDPAAAILPKAGRDAMNRTDQAMREAGNALEDASLDGALDGEQSAWRGLRDAIDSLRQSSPPPPERDGGDSSTEAERDRSLRDEVVEAMREGDRDGFDESTKRYYEELLR